MADLGIAAGGAADEAELDALGPTDRVAVRVEPAYLAVARYSRDLGSRILTSPSAVTVIVRFPNRSAPAPIASIRHRAASHASRHPAAVSPAA